MVRCVKGRGVSTTCRALCLSYSKHLCLAALKKGCHILSYLLYRQGWLQRPVSLKHSKPQVVLVAQCRFKCGERVRPCNTQYSKHLCLAALKKRAATLFLIFFIGKGGYKDQCLSSTASHKLCSWHNVVSNVENVSDPVTHGTPNTCASPH